ncbi:hypothetical protein COA17_17715 [Sphingomonas ginsenosidimutans]|uniref:Uncharacterized protein n=2 Tax=Sphingomonadaceae TaxID=41297 RepID=A0A2A4HU58_9SPHN|nr:hypothetical protein COA17_17715 [Sphingomonas ginsenosidimutans]
MRHALREAYIMRNLAIIAPLLVAFVGGSAAGKSFHDPIPEAFRGTWAPAAADCRDEDGVNKVFVDAESVNYYEGNDYLLIGVSFSGSMTKRSGSGVLFNGRFTGRTEANLLGESNIRMEIDDRDANTMYRYPIGDDGEPIAAREVKDVRCPTK